MRVEGSFVLSPHFYFAIFLYLHYFYLFFIISEIPNFPNLYIPLLPFFPLLYCTMLIYQLVYSSLSLLCPPVPLPSSRSFSVFLSSLSYTNFLSSPPLLSLIMFSPLFLSLTSSHSSSSLSSPLPVISYYLLPYSALLSHLSLFSSVTFPSSSSSVPLQMKWRGTAVSTLSPELSPCCCYITILVTLPCVKTEASQPKGNPSFDHSRYPERLQSHFVSLRLS